MIDGCKIKKKRTRERRMNRGGSEGRQEGVVINQRIAIRDLYSIGSSVAQRTVLVLDY
jgi:hypothetical protein